MYLRSVFLARAPRYVTKDVFSVTPQFQFRWLDRKRPTIPRARGLDNSVGVVGSFVRRRERRGRLWVTIDGKLFTTTTTLSTALPFLSDGGHRITVVAVDRAGNRSRPGVVNLQI